MTFDLRFTPTAVLGASIAAALALSGCSQSKPNEAEQLAAIEAAAKRAETAAKRAEKAAGDATRAAAQQVVEAEPAVVGDEEDSNGNGGQVISDQDQANQGAQPVTLLPPTNG